ncbi:hypothetical protein O181_011853 [Austropuccinia psidii MF-1]|uniref:Uncharacterized protein n=1 Tax=Austropuccinia psidii MF-1 TaxID=1389203 RepID=A0A9Q3BW29_9BASI|nr:hypothetical protein [Austropuccinia psidii MF-1]
MYSVDKDPYVWCLRQSKRLKAIYPQMNIQMRNKKLLKKISGEPEFAIQCRFKQSCTLDKISNTSQDVRKKTNIRKYSSYKSSRPLCQPLSKGKEKVYSIEQVPEEECPTEDSESDPMGDAIREHSNDDQDPK